MKPYPERGMFRMSLPKSLAFLFLSVTGLFAVISAQPASIKDGFSLDSLLQNTLPHQRLWRTNEDSLTASVPDSLLLANGDACYMRGETDSAILYFNILYRRFTEQERTGDASISLKNACMGALNRLGVIHLKSNNNILAFQYFLGALDLCNETKSNSYRISILNNIAIMYAKYMDVEKAYSVFCQIFEDAEREKDFYRASFILNNAVSCAVDMKDPEKTEPWIEKANDSILASYPLSRFAAGIGKAFIYSQSGSYSDAENAIKAVWGDIPHLEDSVNGFASAHFHLSYLSFMQKKYDSAIFHSEKSLYYARQHDNGNLIRDNYRLLADIYMQEGKAASYIRTANQYIRLLDSTFANTQYLYLKDLEFSTINNRYQQKINTLEDAQYYNGRIIKMKDRIIGICISVSFIVILLLLYVYRQKKQEEQKNRLLFEKNAELLAIDRKSRRSNPSRNDSGKNAPAGTNNNNQQALISRIQQIMDETDLFLDADFSLEKLAKELKSNTSYVSHAINESMGKNFTSLVNEYRIKRACRFMAEPENRNYTLEYISSRVGFKSRNTFYVSFKKYIGLTPAQYLRISDEENHRTA